MRPSLVSTTRCPPGPAHAFAATARYGLGVELERLAIERAFEQHDKLPPQACLGSTSAEAIIDLTVQGTILRYAHLPIGVELTEHTQIREYGPGAAAPPSACDPPGVRIFVDDAGGIR